MGDLDAKPDRGLRLAHQRRQGRDRGLLAQLDDAWRRQHGDIAGAQGGRGVVIADGEVGLTGDTNGDAGGHG